MKYAVLFPGQGSQAVGMGAELFDLRPDLLGEAADEVLGWSLRDMCLEGPEEALIRTEHAQPALYAVSYALWSELREHLHGAPAAGAGHSLGEYTALAAAGAFEYFDGLRVVAARGRAMAEAADRESSGMAALIGGDAGSAEGMASARRGEGGRLWVANLNAPGQVVIAGGAEDVDWAVANAGEFGVRRAIPLKVAGAFHSPFMDPAAEALATAIAVVDMHPPEFPVWANATAAPHGDDPAELLVAQMTATVRFGDSLVGIAAAGVGVFLHVGPGDVTAGLARRSVEGAEAIAVSSLDDVTVAADRLAGPSVS
ncbi:MAG TPA: ACP S-malonyltransferase [Acidimicrobiia bacterium]|nr:ACP S-malonyltransferase [Acidimicrobiia bacterium]